MTCKPLTMIVNNTYRCNNTLDQKAFIVTTGHALLLLGNEIESQEVLNALLNENLPKPFVTANDDNSVASILTATKHKAKPLLTTTTQPDDVLPKVILNTRPRAKLPPGPAPLTSARSTASATAHSDRNNKPSAIHQMSSRVAEANPALLNTTRRRPPPPQTLTSPRSPPTTTNNSNNMEPHALEPIRPMVSPTDQAVRYFLTVATDNIGGDTGWGVIGESTLLLLQQFSMVLDSQLSKLYREVDKHRLECLDDLVRLSEQESQEDSLAMMSDDDGGSLSLSIENEL